MTAFTTAELRRLSEAATSGDWIELCCYINGRPRNDVDSLAVRGSVVGPQGYICEAAYQGPRCDDDMRLIAYLGTHRETILRMLEAADALAGAANVAMDGDSRLVGEDFAALVDFYMEQNAALSAKASAGEASANALGRIESALGRAGNFPVDETVQEIEALVAKLRLATAVADYGPRFTDRHMNDAAESVLDELRAALDGRSPI